MVEYYIEAIDPRGKNTSLRIEAKNSSMADEMVRAQGLHPTLITHAKSRSREEQKIAEGKKRRQQFGLVGVLLVAAVLGGGYGMWLYIQSIEASATDGVNNVARVASSDRAARSAFGGTEELTDFARNLYAYLEGKYPGVVRGVTVPNKSTLLVELSFLVEEKPTTLSGEMAELLADMMHGIFETEATVTITYGADDIAVARFENSAIAVQVLQEIGKPVAESEDEVEDDAEEDA